MTGEKCVEILREHYISKGKPCIIVLYTELTSLKMTEDCSLTENDLKAESSLILGEMLGSGVMFYFA